MAGLASAFLSLDGTHCDVFKIQGTSVNTTKAIAKYAAKASASGHTVWI